MSESRRPLKELEMDYGTVAAANDGTRRSLTPPPLPSDYSDPPPPYESLELGQSTSRRHSCPPNPSGTPYRGGGKEFYDAGDYQQLTACIVLACLVTWFFNPVFGIVAFTIAGNCNCGKGEGGVHGQFGGRPLITTPTVLLILAPRMYKISAWIHDP